MSGNGVGQLLQFASIIFLSRLYNPADFGRAGEMQSYASIFAVIVGLQLYPTITLGKGEPDAKAKLLKVQAISIFIFFASLPLFIGIGGNFVFSILLALFVTLNNAYSAFLLFKGDFKNLSIFYVVRSIGIISIQFLLVPFNIQDGLIYGMIAGEAFACSYLIYLCRECLSEHGALVKQNITVLFNYIKEKKAFSLYGTLQELNSVLSFYAPLLLFIKFYGDDIGGQFSMGNRLVWAPTILVSSSVASVFLHQFSQKNNLSITKKIMWINWKYVAAAILVIIPFFYFDIVTFFIGKEWGLAQQLIPYMLLCGAIFIYSIPYRVAYRVLEKQKQLLLIELVILALTGLIFMFDLTPITTMKLLVAITLTQLILIYAGLNYPRSGLGPSKDDLKNEHK